MHTSAPASDGFKDYDRWHCHGVTAVTPGGIGSVTLKTIGIVSVTAFATNAAAVPLVAITATTAAAGVQDLGFG